jgi:hypothetical protein
LDILRGFKASFDGYGSMWPDYPRILVAHCDVEGSKTDPDQPAMVGGDIKLSLEDLMLAGADVVLLGHIHLPQEWDRLVVHSCSEGAHHLCPPIQTVPIIYAGSPRRTAYSKGETVPKGYVVLEFEGRSLVTWERVPTPATPMRLLDVRWQADSAVLGFAGDDLRGFDPRDAEIRLRYHVAADAREAARAEAARFEAEWRSLGAADVKLDEIVVPIVRARAPEVAKATTIAGALEATWASQGDKAPDEDRRKRLLAMAATLEETR